MEHVYWDRWWGSHGSTWEAAPCWSFENNAGLPIGFIFQGPFLYSLLDSLLLLHYTVFHGYLCLSIADYFYTTSNIFLNIYYYLMDILDKVRWLWSCQVGEKEEDHTEVSWMEWRSTCRWLVLKRRRDGGIWSAVLAPKRSSWKQKNGLHWQVLQVRIHHVLPSPLSWFTCFKWIILCNKDLCPHLYLHLKWN